MTRPATTRIAFTAPEKAELVSWTPDRQPLRPHEVGGPTVATLISAGTELALYQGLHREQSFPAYPGYAAAFEVAEMGHEVQNFRVGDIAFCMGPHASYQRVEEAGTLPIPTGLAPEIALFARMMGVSMTTLVTTAAHPPDLVAVTGLGLIGNLAAQIFQHCGYEVLACDPLSSRRRIAQEVGIRQVLPALPREDPKVSSRVSLVVECSGHEQAVLDACKIVQKGGEVVLVGVPWKRQTELYAHNLLHLVFHHYVLLRSGWEWELPSHEESFRPHSIFGNLSAALNWIAAGKILVEPLYQTASPTGGQQAYQSLLLKQVERPGIVLDWRETNGIEH